MHEQPVFPYLRETLLFLALAGILIPLLARLRINQVVGFLAAGALFGPFGLGLFAANHPWLSYVSFARAQGVGALAELGVMFLMFMIGLELSAARLWSLRRWVIGTGSAQLLISSLLLGAAAWLVCGRLDSAILLGLVLSLSSTAVVMQLLSAQKATASPLGQASFAILMLQDLAVVPLLILIGALGQGTGQGLGMVVALALGKAALAIAAIYLVGGRIVHPLFRAFTRHRQTDVFMALILLTTLGIASLSAAAGLSMALGALIAGVLLAETEFKHEVELMIEPFKGLLMGLFFMTVGMGMDMRQMVASPLWLAAAVVGLMAIKGGVIALLLRAGGLRWGRAIEGGLLLGQGGEFAFIALGQATAAHLLAPDLAQMVSLTVGLSLLLTPPLARLGHGLAQRWEKHSDLAAVSPDNVQLDAVRGRIIIAGFGRVGRQLAKLLTAQGIAFVAFDTDARLVARLRTDGHPVYFGDAARAELLERVDAGAAPAIVLTMDHAASALHAVRGIRRIYPHLPVYARSRDESHARALKLAGASIVVPETLEASLQLAACALEATGLSGPYASQIIDAERAQVLAVLGGQAENAR